MPFAFNRNPLDALPSIMLKRATLKPDDVVIMIKDNKILVSNNSPLLRSESTEISKNSTVLQLGKYKDKGVFIHGSQCDATSARLGDNWWDLRRIATEIQADLASIAAQACAINHWHQNHRYCAKCGNKTQLSKEHSRACENTNCSKVAFPRVDPAMIVSVVNENDEILLAHQADWETGMYSVLAGFLNHGESLENCVKREVKEETGVTIETVDYIGSQPWPFPGAIMIGFHATAKNQRIVLADQELQDAIWISRQSLREKIEDEKDAFKISNKYSISRHLIERWLNPHLF